MACGGLLTNLFLFMAFVSASQFEALSCLPDRSSAKEGPLRLREASAEQGRNQNWLRSENLAGSRSPAISYMRCLA